MTYPDVGFKTISLAEDFHRDLRANPCGAGCPIDGTLGRAAAARPSVSP